MTEQSVAPKVLISYSHDSPEHLARVLALSDQLRAEGVDSQVDQYETSPPEGWPRWTWNQVEWADFVLVLCTATYHRRFRGLEEKGKGHGVNWEGIVITQDLYDAAARNTKFIPVVFSDEEAAHIPVILRGSTFYVVSTEEGYEALYRRLTNQPRTQKPGLGKRRPLPQRTHHTPDDGSLPPPAAAAHAFVFGGTGTGTADVPRPEPTEPAQEEGRRTPSPRPAFGTGRLLVLLALVVGAAVAAYSLWRYASMPPRGATVQYRGRVVAKDGGRAISGATVSVESADGPPASARTDSTGVFSLRLSPPGDEVRVRVEAEGFNVLNLIEKLSTAGFREHQLVESRPPSTPTPTPAPSPAPTRRPIIPRPTRIPCTVERKARGLC